MTRKITHSKKKVDHTNKAILILIILVIIAAYFFYRTEYPNSDGARVYTSEKVTESRGKLIEGFPEVPVYPEITLDNSYKREQDGKVDYNAYWYHEVPDEEIPALFKWYIDELKNRGWTVTGPFADEAEDELNIRAENGKYKLMIYNSERGEDDNGGPPGELIGVQFIEK